VRRILVVEDSGAMRALIGAALEGLEEKLEIDEAESGFAALRMLPRQAYDLIVTDINMPDINGLELVSFVKRDPRYRGTPLVIVSTIAAGARPCSVSIAASRVASFASRLIRLRQSSQPSRWDTACARAPASSAPDIRSCTAFASRHSIDRGAL